MYNINLDFNQAALMTCAFITFMPSIMAIPQFMDSGKKIPQGIVLAGAIALNVYAFRLTLGAGLATGVTIWAYGKYLNW